MCVGLLSKLTPWTVNFDDLGAWESVIKEVTNPRYCPEWIKDKGCEPAIMVAIFFSVPMLFFA